MQNQSTPTSRWQNARHVDFLDEHLVNLAAGEYAKEGYIGIIIEEPPRHGKSEECSRYFPAWYLGLRPDDRVILASYEATFAERWGGRVRDLLSRWGPEVFGIEISKKAAAASLWDIDKHEGGMYTAGVGGPITGKGANLLILDDPIKNSAEAQSPTIRENQWEWYKSTFRTRAEPGAIILIIMTRWHEDDLVGRILAEQAEDPDADKFMRIRLPAIAEEPDEEFPEPDPLGRLPGEALWPERWPVDKLTPYMTNDYVWSALYQQRPAPREGGLFKRDWFDVVPLPSEKPKKVVRYWDMAATEVKKGEDPDWTVGCKVALYPDGTYCVLDVERVRKSPEKVEALIKRTAVLDGRLVRIRMEQEPGSAGKGQISHYSRNILRGFIFKGNRVTGSKTIRAELASSKAEKGEIKVARAPWNREFFREVTKFPNAKWDDQVDAFSGAIEDLASGGNRMVTW